MTVVNADPQQAIEPAAEPAPDLLPAPVQSRAFERRQTRELLEQHITLPVILEALEFAIADEPEEDALGQPTTPSKYRQMYEHMLNPSTGCLPDPLTGRVRYPVDTVMARYKVKLPELLALIGARNLGMAIARSGERLSRVIDGLGEAAEPQTVPCLKCEGEGYLPSVHDGEDAPMCPKCNGAGEVRKFGDLKAAEMFIGLHGGSTSGQRGGPATGAVRDIIVSASAGASAKVDKAGADAEPINVRVQKLIDQ